MLVAVERISSLESLIRPRMGTTMNMTYGRALISSRLTMSNVDKSINVHVDRPSVEQTYDILVQWLPGDSLEVEGLATKG